MLEKKKIHPPYISKHNSNHQKQVILSMISNGEGWNYLAVKKLSALLRGKTSEDQWFLLPELHSFFCNRKKIESHKK